jgi:hypothetical protein|tara:strand:+ start:221 stop:448 length:228 start_codon:yes stop_codon:yes gene_type:complete
MLNEIPRWIRTITEAGIALLALAIVVQIMFGKAVPFVGGDVIGSISGIIGSLGAQGLVGLIAAAVVYALFNRGPA